MRTSLLACTAAALGLFALAGTAGASQGFEKTIPNGTCGACHIQAPQTNLFGAAVIPIKGTPQSTWWPTLRGPNNDVDSDIDGQSNAQELGDPCGTWTMGDPTAPRTINISNPGDPNVTSTTPNDPPCGMGAGGAGGAGAASSSGATTTGAGPGSGPTGSGGSGDPKSTGAGLGEEPATVRTGACASTIAPTGSGGAGAAAWLALAVVALKRRRR